MPGIHTVFPRYFASPSADLRGIFGCPLVAEPAEILPRHMVFPVYVKNPHVASVRPDTQIGNPVVIEISELFHFSR